MSEESRAEEEETREDAQFRYSPVQSDWGPPDGQPVAPKVRKHRGLLIGWGTTLSVIIVVALAVSVGVHIHQLGWEHSEYGYDIVERATVEADQPWVINLPIMIPDVTASSVGIYTDPELTYPVPFATSTDSLVSSGRKRTLTPSQSVVHASNALPQPIKLLTLGGDSWPTGVYYVVERQGFFGKILERPRVHIYTVEPGSNPDQSLNSPDFTMDVADGTPTFTWTSAANASQYYILKSTPTRSSYPLVKVIGWASGDATSWRATDQDMNLENARQNELDIASYNADFQAIDLTQSIATSCRPQDADYYGLTPPQWDDSTLVYPSYAVVAATSKGVLSLPEFQNGRDLIVATPVGMATNTYSHVALNAGTEFVVQDGFPVIMGDCRTVFYPTVAQSMKTNFYQHSIAVSFSVTDTRLTKHVIKSNQSDDAIQGLSTQLGLRILTQQSLPTETSLSTMSTTPANQATPSADEPDTPYTWNGTSDMVKFIAANLYAETPAIDLSHFAADPTSPLIIDAANEALLQNPYLTSNPSFVQVVNDVLYVTYGTTAEDQAASAARIKAKVDEVTASIITGSMSERDKAAAINTYLAQNAVYGSAPNDWNTEGVLLDGAGWGSSYASAFKALADASGLNSVTVTGSLGDESSHAWVKAQIDGSWWVIDPAWNSFTWDQTGGNIQTYFMLTDAQADRTEFDDFVVDSHIGDYDTP